MRILITGSTSWDDAQAIRRELVCILRSATIVTGDTPGVDLLAIAVCGELGLGVESTRKNRADHKAHPGEGWKGLNERMLASGIDLVLAFHPDFGKPGCARGTQHAVELAAKAGIETRIFLR
jgi:hypothetical protein